MCKMKFYLLSNTLHNFAHLKCLTGLSYLFIFLFSIQYDFKITLKLSIILRIYNLILY
jgi:hypothetical protein